MTCSEQVRMMWAACELQVGFVCSKPFQGKQATADGVGRSLF